MYKLFSEHFAIPVSGVGIFSLLFYGYSRTYDYKNTFESGTNSTADALKYATISLVLQCSFAIYLTLVATLRGTCLGAIARDSFHSTLEMNGGSSDSNVGTTGGFDPARGLPVFDRESLLLAGKWGVLFWFSMVIFYHMLGEETSGPVSTMVTHGTALFYLLPRAARRWYPARGYELSRAVVYAILIGVPLMVLPPIIVPRLLNSVSVDTLSAIYPIGISLLEHVVIRRVLSERVVQGYTPEGMSAAARGAVAIFEGSRLGLLTVATNSGGTMTGLIFAVLVSAVLEALTRNHVFRILRRMCHCTKDWSRPLEHGIGRFQRVYLGCKTGTEYVGVYLLVLMRLSNSGFDSAVDHETERLKPSLRCSYEEIAVILCGEILGDMLSFAVGCCLHWRSPALFVPKPLLYPGPDVLVNLVMWMFVANAFFMTISGVSDLGDDIRSAR